MFRFVTEFEPSLRQLKLGLRKDADNDLEIVATNEAGDSVALGFVSNSNGRLYRYVLGTESRRTAEQMGIPLTDQGEWQAS